MPIAVSSRARPPNTVRIRIMNRRSATFLATSASYVSNFGGRFGSIAFSTPRIALACARGADGEIPPAGALRTLPDVDVDLGERVVTRQAARLDVGDDANHR